MRTNDSFVGLFGLGTDFAMIHCKGEAGIPLFLSSILPHHKRSIVVLEAQPGVFHKGSFHCGRNRSDPPAALDTWHTRNMLGASRGSTLLWRQKSPFPLH